MTLLVFTDAFLKASTLFDELYVLQVYNIAALTVICEVWQCCSCSVVEGILNHMFLVMFVCIRSIALCISWPFGAILSERFL